MELPTIEVPQEQAKAAYVEYRHARRSAKQSELNREDAEIARCYKALSEGKAVLNIDDAIAEGGLDDNGLPRLAIARADYTRLLMTRNFDAEARSEMYPERLRGASGEYDRTQHVYEGEVFRFVLPPAEAKLTERRMRWDGNKQIAVDVPASVFQTIVPSVPPRFRPIPALHNYHILFEAEWRVDVPRRAPGDPALLKHLSGSLYAVLAVWDLTPIEQAVLGITRG